MISIIVPVYNSSKYLDGCINNILNQTYVDWELLLVDDGSTDNSYEICKKYEMQDKRIRVFHKQNGGQGSARNLGLDNARGEYVGFIDSDDFIHPEYYETLFKLVNEFEADIACCHYQFIKTDELVEFQKINYEEVRSNAQVINSADFLKHFDKYFRSVSWISPCTKLYKKEVFKNVRYPEDVIDEDSYILHHFVANSKKMVRVENKLYYYVWTQNSTSRNDSYLTRFDKSMASLDRVRLFESIGLKDQQDFFERQYLLDTIEKYYLVKNDYPQYIKNSEKYIEEYRRHIWNFIKNNTKICKIEKVIYSSFAISPKIAEGLYNKYLQ